MGALQEGGTEPGRDWVTEEGTRWGGSLEGGFSSEGSEGAFQRCVNLCIRKSFLLKGQINVLLKNLYTSGITTHHELPS